MSFGKRQDGNVIYFRVAGGKLVRSAKADTPGAVAVKTPTGETVYQLHDDFIEGMITAFDEKTSDFNGKTTRSLVVVMSDTDEVYRIEMTRGKQYWADLLLRLPNVDLSKRITLSPYDITDKDTGSRNQGISMKQQGQKITRAFTKDNPGNLPQPKEIEIDGEKKLDWGPRNKYLEEVVLIEAKQRLNTEPQAGSEPVAADGESDGEFNDMPWDSK